MSIRVLLLVGASLELASCLDSAHFARRHLNLLSGINQASAGRTAFNSIRKADSSPLRLNGGAGSFKKTFSLGSMLQDHVTIMTSIPAIFGAYAGPHRIDPASNEAIMLAVNSVNDCPYCSGIHGELARMSGLDTSSSTKKSASKHSNEAKEAAMVAYAKEFGRFNGRGDCLKKKYKELEATTGKDKAASVQALCWFLHWGSISGNTILSFFRGRLSGNPKPGSNIVFELLFAAYYTPLYLVISATTLIFKAFPRVPKAVSMVIGCTLTTVASVWIIPVGVVGLITAPFRREEVKIV
jgi:AhpD family alkylhydroperoxidase